jgi:plastocyanin
VVDASAPATSQAENDFRGNIQFNADRADATAAEAANNVPRFNGGLPGRRTYDVAVGVTSANLHANVLEMLPQHLDLVDGDKVTYSWKKARNEAHTVTFPADSPNQPGLAFFDCGATVSPIFAPPCIDPVDHQPEPVFDPGFNPSGSPLTNPAAIVDSGVLVGPAEAAAYHLSPTAEQWSVTTNAATQAGTYTYQCQIHDVMVGSLSITR